MLSSTSSASTEPISRRRSSQEVRQGNPNAPVSFSPSSVRRKTDASAIKRPRTELSRDKQNVFAGFRPHEPGELIRRHRRDLGAAPDQTIPHLRLRQDLVDGLVQLRHDLARRAGGREDSDPMRHVDVLHAGLRQGRNVRQRGRPFRGGHGERLRLAGGDLRQRREQYRKGEIAPPVQQSLERRAAAFERHMGEPRASPGAEEFAGEMSRRPWASGPEQQAARRRPRGFQQLVDARVGRIAPGGQDERDDRDESDRLKILVRKVADITDEGPMDDNLWGLAEEQRAPVRRCARNALRANRARAARPVLDRDRLTEGTGELVSDDARHKVADPARRKGNDKLDGTGGGSLGLAKRDRRDRHAGDRGEQDQVRSQLPHRPLPQRGRRAGRISWRSRWVPPAGPRSRSQAITISAPRMSKIPRV